MNLRFRPKAYFLAVLAFAIPAHADRPVPHEYFAPNAADDLQMAVPAHASYRVDPDTSPPKAVRYDDPFTPAMTPYKRSYAYDGLDENFQLVVDDKQLHVLPIGGEAGPDDERFHGELFVYIVPGVPVRIPSVGPGTRVLGARTEPELSFALQRDGADNWFVVGDAHQRVRLVLELAIARSAFRSEFGEVSWSELARRVPALPPATRAAARAVLRAIGIPQQQRPADQVRWLIDYFRGFIPSADAPRASSGAALYSELTLSKKGVCRHRAYAFVVSALSLDIPARLVHNEAHAWAEVLDGRSWHRVDLGGAASNFEQQSGEHEHQQLEDPYQGPLGSGTGTSLVPPSFDEPPPPTPRDDPHSKNEVAISSNDHTLRRGARFHVTGLARTERSVCANSVVQIALRDKAGVEYALGALPTGRDGKYDGSLALPADLELGNYAASATISRTAQCGGSAR